MEENNLSISEIVKTEGWKNFSKRLELYTAILLVIIIIMWIAGLSKNSLFGVIFPAAMMTLAVLCFFIAFNLFESESKIMRFLFFRIYGFGLSIAFVCLLFIRQNWPFPKEIMAVVSALMILVSLILGLREVSGENINKIDWKYFTRIIIALIPLSYYLIQEW